MTNFTYNLNLPNGPDNPSSDQPGMQQNTNSVDGIIAVDHVGFNVNNGGYHTVVHLLNNSVTPAPVPFVGELYNISQADGIGADDVLYFQTGGGINTKFSRNFAPTVAANGATFLPGGLILNWGTATGLTQGSGASNNVSFTQNFTATPYSIVVTAIQGSTTTVNSLYVLNGSVSTGGFTIVNTSTTITSAYWFAIGS